MSAWRERGPSAVLGVGAVVFVLVLAAAIGYYVSLAPAGPPLGSQRAIVWQTNVASLEADSITIRAGELAFTGEGARFSFRSHEGNARSRTLEVEWREQGREMRLYVYFEADASHWWVREIASYDGRAPADWISYRGPLLRTEQGARFEGRLELDGGEGRVAGGLTIENLRLSAFAPGTAYGDEGQVIVFVSDRAPRTLDPNPPQSVACS